eukprot:gene15664-21187_t
MSYPITINLDQHEWIPIIVDKRKFRVLRVTPKAQRLINECCCYIIESIFVLAKQDRISNYDIVMKNGSSPIPEGRNTILICQKLNHIFMEETHESIINRNYSREELHNVMQCSNAKRYIIKKCSNTLGVMNETKANQFIQTISDSSIINGNESILTSNNFHESIGNYIATSKSLTHLTEHVVIFEKHHGTDLFQHIQTNGALSDDNAKELFRQLVECVHRLHQVNIVHRDLSPMNILIDPTLSKLRLIDFEMSIYLEKQCAVINSYNNNNSSNNPASITQHPNASTVLTSVLGTPSYGMSPEVYSHSFRPLKPSATNNTSQYNPYLSDNWALGIILFVMLCGIPLYEFPHQSDKIYSYYLRNGMNAIMEEWEFLNISPLAIDLLEKLLKPEPLERILLQDILKHDWLTSCGNDLIEGIKNISHKIEDEK